MSNRFPWSASRLLASLIGLFLIVVGVAMAFGGFKLMGLGGSWYYLVAGVAFGLSGLLLLAGLRLGIILFALTLLGSCGWAYYEVGLDWWELVPRLAMWAVIGLVLLLPWARHAITRADGRGVGITTPLLVVSVIVAFGMAIASQFTDPDSLNGTIATNNHYPADPAYVAGEDWPAYGGTQAGNHYSSLDQINVGNVDQLTKAWEIQTGDRPGPGDPAEITFENTPLKINNTLYVCTPHSQVLALDPDTGRTKWHYNTKLSLEGAKDFSDWAHMTCRGVTYYSDADYGSQPSASPTQDDNASANDDTLALSTSPDAAADAPTQANDETTTPEPAETQPSAASTADSNVSVDPTNTQNAPATDQCPRRIFLPTADARLIAINADNGRRCAGFGDDGVVNLARNIREFAPGGYYSTSPPVVTRNLVIIGGHVTDNASTDEPSGVVRAYDVHTGKLVWNWDSGNPTDTQPIGPDEHYTRNSPNVWSTMSVDEKAGLLYLPVGNHMPDQFGGNRPPATEKFSSSIVALHVDTGQVAWHQQLTHHDLWDMDPPAQPVLTDMKTPAGMQPVVIVPTKQGDLYVFNRETGAPAVPVNEVPAPQGAVEGDYTANTQPKSRLNLVPPALTEADMWGATPLDQMMCRIQFKSLRYEGQYTPPSLQGSISYPGNVGVMNWGGVAVNPSTQSLFVAPKYLAFVLQLVPREKANQMEKAKSENGGLQPNAGAPYAVKIGPLLSPLKLPCQAPSWGDVAGVDMERSKVVWKHPNGTTRDQTPIVPIPLHTGVPALGGPITTAGGVAFEAGTLDYYIRGYNAATGEQLWKARLPAGGNATPMTYEGSNGQQYVLIAAGGHGTFGTKFGDYVIAYRLPASAQ